MDEHQLRAEVQRIVVKHQMQPKTAEGDAQYKSLVREQLTLFGKINQINGWQESIDVFNHPLDNLSVIHAFEIAVANLKRPQGTPRIISIVDGERSDRMALVMAIEFNRGEPLPLPDKGYQQIEFLNNGFIYDTELGHILSAGLQEALAQLGQVTV